MFRFVFLLLSLVVGPASAQGSECTAGRTLGPNPELRADSASTDPPRIGFLAISNAVDCHGTIREWEIHYPGWDNGQACHNLRLQVWRPTGTGSDTYQLVAEDFMDFKAMSGCDVTVDRCIVPPLFRIDCGAPTENSCGNQPQGCCWDPNPPAGAFQCYELLRPPAMPGPDLYKLEVPRGNRIQVIPGDVLGWVEDGVLATSTSRIYSWSSDLTGSGLYGVVRARTVCTGGVGDTCDWAEGSAGGALHYVRDYSLQATYDTTSEPWLENVPTVEPVRVKELQPPGVFVYRVVGNSRHRAEAIVPPPITYVITGGNTGGAFNIDPETGEIFTLVELVYRTTNEYNLIIEVRTGPLASSEVLTIRVVELNKPHELQDWPLRKTIDCLNDNAGNVVATGRCVDDDTVGPLKTIYYVPSDPGLGLFDTGKDGPGTWPLLGELELARAVRDWTGTNITYVDVYCSDGVFVAGPHTIQFALINLRKPPYFRNLPGRVDFNENDAFPPYQVESWFDQRATEDYTLTRQFPQSPKVDWKFDLPNTEVVGAAGATFDYFECSLYEVEVSLVDPLFTVAPQNLTVSVQWVNQKPVFLPDQYTAMLPELVPAGTVLPGVTLRATDRDSLRGDWISFSLSGSRAYQFRVDNNTGRVYTTDPDLRIQDGLDVEGLVLQARVHDSYGESDTADLYVTLTDVNNHAPEFSPDYYEGHISETDPSGTVVVTVTALDRDGPQNNHLTYYMDDPEADRYFEVGAWVDGGRQLVVKQPVSHARHPGNITFVLRAVDNGLPALTGEATVVVYITDENVNRPQFAQDFYNTEARSDLPRGATVVTVTANDLDTPETSPVTYFLLVPDTRFAVTGDSGAVVTARSPPLPPGSKHLLYVYARDGEPGNDTTMYTDPCIVRVDVYRPEHHLVDIHLQLPLADFLPLQDDFLGLLNEQLAPWIVKPEKVILDGVPSRTLVTVYALADSLTQTVDDIELKKNFVHRDDLLHSMRTDIKGSPRDWLLGGPFSGYQPVSVLPTYPRWFTDTVGGIVTLTLLCLAAAAGLTAAILAVLRHYRLLCFKENTVSPSELPRPPADEFNLSYRKEPIDYSRPNRSPPPMYTSKAEFHKNPKMRPEF